MKTLKLSLLAVVGVLAMSSAAYAQDEGGLKPAFNIGAASDYVFRGYSQTLEDPQVFGGADLAIGQFYVGAWVSNVDFGNGTDAEYDLYAGFKPVLGAVTLDFAAIRYGYAGSPSKSGQDYWEIKAAASVPAGPATFGVAMYYSPDFFGAANGDDAIYYEANAAVAIPETKFSVSGALGRQVTKPVYGPDYTTWNAGVGFAITDHVGVDLRYHDTNIAGTLSDGRVVVGLKATF